MNVMTMIAAPIARPTRPVATWARFDPATGLRRTRGGTRRHYFFSPIGSPAGNSNTGTPNTGKPNTGTAVAANPYRRWDQCYPAAHVDRALAAITESDDADGRAPSADQTTSISSPPAIVLTDWSAAWNDDPQTLIQLRLAGGEIESARIGVVMPPDDPSSVVDLMRTGWIDLLAVPMRLDDQRSAAWVLPVAEETATDVIALIEAPNRTWWQSSDDRRAVDAWLNSRGVESSTAAIKFMTRFDCITDIVVDSCDAATVNAAVNNTINVAGHPPSIGDDVIEAMKRLHGCETGE